MKPKTTGKLGQGRDQGGKWGARKLTENSVRKWGEGGGKVKKTQKPQEKRKK
jgi:hypothetical protein